MPDQDANVKIFKSRMLPFVAEDVWKVLRQFGSPLHWNPGVVRVELNGADSAAGCIRDLHIHDGKIFKEELIAIDDQKRTVLYKIIDCPMAIWDYTARNRVIPITASNESLVIWDSCFTCSKFDKEKMEFYFGVSAYEEGLKGIEKFLHTLS